MPDRSPGPRIGGSTAGDLRFAIDMRPSAIDGIGAFAGEQIPKGRKLGEIAGRWTSVRDARSRARQQARVAIIELTHRVALDATDSDQPLRFLNHHCAGNAFMRIALGRVEIYSRRDIDVGEEITLRYGLTHHEGRLRCRCGSSDCSRYL